MKTIIQYITIAVMLMATSATLCDDVAFRGKVMSVMEDGVILRTVEYDYTPAELRNRAIFIKMNPEGVIDDMMIQVRGEPCGTRRFLNGNQVVRTILQFRATKILLNATDIRNGF